MRVPVLGIGTSIATTSPISTWCMRQASAHAAVEIRFRCHDAALSVAAVNALVSAYDEQENETEVQATTQASVFGPYEDPTSHYSGVLAIFCRKMLAGEQPTTSDQLLKWRRRKHHFYLSRIYCSWRGVAHDRWDFRSNAGCLGNRCSQFRAG